MVRQAAFSLDRSRQVAVQIHEILKDRILKLVLQPGTALSRLALQDEFGVSQTPVRDALLRLQEDGLVNIFPQHATQVSRIDIKHARQAQFLRLSVELEAIRRLVASSPIGTGEMLEAILRQQKAVAREETYDQFGALDREFHRVLYVRTDNEQIWKVIRQQSAHLDRLRRLNLPMPGKMQSLLAEHGAIAKAIKRADAEEAVAAMRKHLSGTLSIIESIRRQFPDFVDDELDDFDVPVAI